MKKIMIIAALAAFATPAMADTVDILSGRINEIEIVNGQQHQTGHIDVGNKSHEELVDELAQDIIDSGFEIVIATPGCRGCGDAANGGSEQGQNNIVDEIMSEAVAKANASPVGTLN